MKTKGWLIALAVILVPIGTDLLVRTLMISSDSYKRNLSSRFTEAYIQLLPFYIVYVVLVIVILSLYNHNKSKNKSH